MKLENHKGQNGNLTADEIIRRVTEICRKHKVEHLSLFGPYAAGNPRKTSDMDFVISGYDDFEQLNEEIQNILTLKRIDLFDYDRIKNQDLLGDIREYAKKIYQKV